jgi:hypothetical protein
MTRHFNGVYSVRAGYHGVRKSGGAININSDFWTCENGHRNPKFELVDDRASGGSVHRQQVKTCKQCERDGLLRLLDALRSPQTVEEYEPVDLDAVDCDTPEVSEAMDARNSRPFPF